MKKYASIPILLFAALYLQACGSSSDNGSPNRVADVKSCISVESDKCLADQSGFNSGIGQIFIATKVDNAVKGSTAICTVRHMEGTPRVVATREISIDAVSATGASDLIFPFSSNEPWEPGKYQVTIRTDSTGKPTQKVFTVS